MEPMEVWQEPMEQETKKRSWRKPVFIAIGLAVVVGIAIAALIFALFNMDKESPVAAQAWLQAMVEEDVESAWELMYPGMMEREEFEDGFYKIVQFWKAQGGGETFTLRRTAWSINFSGGLTEYEAEFTVKTGETRFHMILTRLKQGERTGVVGVKLI